MNEVEPHYIIVEGKRLPVIVKKHPRAKSMVVRYDSRSGCILLTVPKRARVGAGLEFVRGKVQWVAAQMAKRPRRPFVHGMEIPLFGETVVIIHVGGRGVVRREVNRLLMPGDADFLPRRVRDHIKRETQTLCEMRAKQHAEKLGVRFRSLAVRETVSRWGSCSSSGAISICWRLAFAPFEVLDYIVVHEVAHLRHHNHGEAYWRGVEMLCPDYMRHERWLARNGADLWGWG